MTHDLEPGDFLYQSDQELFLCVTNVTDDEVQFAVHGWRNIGADRVDEYIESNRSNIHKDIESALLEEGDESDKKQFNQLKQLFSVYEHSDVPENGPHERFALDET